MICTIILVIKNCALGCVIPNIGSAMTLVGSSINPIIGFIIPVVFYWKIIKDKPWYHTEKVIGAIVVIVIIVVSVLSLIKFFSDLAN